MSAWKTFRKGKRRAIAICNFKKEGQVFLNLKIGDIIDILEETENWYRGFLNYSPENKGIFPKSFVSLFESEKLNSKDKSVQEIEEVLREWTVIWLEKFDEIEQQKKNHCLMGYFKNGLNLKNVIVENRASIDEINDLKKSNLGKILQGNHILELDVYAFDSNSNRLQSKDTTTLFLYEELKKNSEISNNSLQSSSFNVNTSKDDQVNESFLQKFEHKPSTISQMHFTKPSSNYCLKVSLESIDSGSNVQFALENTDLCLNLFLYKENSPENSFYLCENAFFKMTDLINETNINIIQSSQNAFQRASLIHTNEKYVFFCDLDEKDFEYTKKGFKLLLVAYSIKYTKQNDNDLLASINKKVAGGLYDLGSSLCNLVYVTADIRNFQASMILYLSEFDSSVVCPKNISDYLNIKDVSDAKNSRLNKDMFINLTFRIELFELSFKQILNKFGHLSPKICRKMDFPEIIMPDDFRNEFFITIIGGEFQKARNYELVVNVIQFRNDNEKKIEEPVSFDENSDQKKYFFYKSIVYIKQDKPKWNEIVKISIPLDKKVKDLRKLFLRILVRNRGQDTKDKNKIIGISYLPITNEDGSTIKDLHCFLPIHKIDSEVEHSSISGCFIPLKYQYATNNYFQSNPEKLKEFLEIKVKVVSTQLTQNVTLLNLLSFPTYENLDENNYKCLLEYLNELSSLKEDQKAEIVKFLQAILDKLIDILLDLTNRNEKISQKTTEFHIKFIQPRVFEILVFIFQMIENQTKYASFRSVIDAYLEKSFCITLVHKPIIRIFGHLLTGIYEKYNLIITHSCKEKNILDKSRQSSEEVFYQTCLNSSVETIYEDKDELTLNAIKSLEFIFKFAFRSRELLSIYNKSSYVNNKEENFDHEVENIFRKLVGICKLNYKILPNDNVIKAQIFILKNVVNLIPILISSNRYTMEFIAIQYVGFFSNQYVFKTQFLSKILQTKLFDCSESRIILLEPICNIISFSLTFEKELIGSKVIQEIELVGKVTAELINKLEMNKIEAIKDEVIQVSTLLPCLTGLFLYINDGISIKQLFGTNIIAIMRILNSECIYKLIDSSDIDESVNDFLNNSSSYVDKLVFKFLMKQKEINQESKISQIKMLKLIYLCNTLMKEEIFPKNWFEFIILRNQVVFHVLSKISEKLVDNYLENLDQINKTIWTDYFNCLVLIATDPCLERKKIEKSKYSEEKTVDIRIQIVNEIKKMWYNLADKKQHFIPNLVSPFIKVSLLPLTEIQCVIIPIIFDMINCEYVNKGTKIAFDEFMVPKLIITTLDQQLEFETKDITFRHSFQKIMNEKFANHSILNKNRQYVKNVVDLFDLLIEYSEAKIDSSDQLKSFYLNEILNFYRNLKRYDIYVKYIEKLRKIHIQGKNLVCAANTLKLHAELLYWTDEELEDYLIHKSFPNEKIHKNLKELLFVQLIKDYTLGQAWEKAFEFSKILRGIYESDFNFDKLCGFLRQQAELCEKIIKNNRFECKYFLVGFYGKKFPKLLQNKRFVFRSEPLEQIITFRQKVESWFPNSERISHSYPVTKNETESLSRLIQVISVNPIYEPSIKFKTKNISPKVIKYYKYNEINKFKYSYRKDSKLNEDDPTLWWLIEKYITISNPLPDVINFYEIIDEKTIQISPIQNAINIVHERLEMLKEALNKIDAINQVSEADKLLIQGTIDPGVLGGLPKYKKFFNEYLNDEDIINISTLKELINETIFRGEELLEMSLNYLPTDHLLNIIKNEQLPKLKKLFDISENKLVRYEENASLLESTPKIVSKLSNHSDQNSLNKSFLNKVQENYTGRTILSYFGMCDKPNSSSFAITSNNSQRESISSIKSLNSEEDFNNRKIILDETLSSKRPLRRFQNLNLSNTSNSNQSSRPISNLSADEINFYPSLQIFENNNFNKLEDNFNNKAPPKPPKTKIAQMTQKDYSDQNIFSETSKKDQNKSTTSLQFIPYRSLSSKTNSDSILNKDKLF